MAIDIALINKVTGHIDNVVVCSSLDAAQAANLDVLCIERGTLYLEPGGYYIDGVVTRAPTESLGS